MALLAEILSSKMRAEVFRILFGLGLPSLHTREIQRRSGLAMGTVQQELRKLVRLGLILRRKDGNRVCYQANRSHPLYEDIHRVVLKTAGLTDRLRAALSDPQIRWAFVFGSVARGEEKADSDIDLMVIGPVGLRRLTAMLSGVAEEVGREINPHVLTQEEFLRRKASREHLVTRVLAGPKLFVVGEPDEFEGMA
jgi:predicted nucleotidyltransferase